MKWYGGLFHDTVRSLHLDYGLRTFKTVIEDLTGHEVVSDRNLSEWLADHNRALCEFRGVFGPGYFQWTGALYRLVRPAFVGRDRFWYLDDIHQLARKAAGLRRDALARWRAAEKESATWREARKTLRSIRSWMRNPSPAA